MNAQHAKPEGAKAPGPVLVAIDFSADSAAALAWGMDYAARIGARVIALHVVHDPADAPGFYKRSGKSSLEPLGNIAEDMMDRFLDDFAAAHPRISGVPGIRKEFVTGLPPGRITEVADREGACAIVMGTRGRSGLSGLLLGSVAQGVLQRASLPVIVVKADPPDEDSEA